MAQSGSAFALGAKGRKFESCLPDSKYAVFLPIGRKSQQQKRITDANRFPIFFDFLKLSARSSTG